MTLWRCDELLSLAERAEAHAGTESALAAAVDPQLPFPTALDCWHTVHASRMLAIVLFCQILGRADAGNLIASNAQMQAAMRRAVAIAFPDPALAKRYKALESKLLDARHKALAHAEGSWMNVRDHGHVVQFNAHEKALEGIDFAFFREAAAALRDAIGQIG